MQKKTSVVDKFFSFFGRKEEIKDEGLITNENDEIKNDKAIVVEGTDGDMVLADNFDDSSTTPEEYKVNDEDLLIEEESSDEIVDDGRGIDITEGDDMTPIIMSVNETEELVENVNNNSFDEDDIEII